MSVATNLTKLESDISNAYSMISTKGGTIPSNKNTDNLSNAINSIPAGPAPEAVEKDVTFYDYDGKKVYSYTKTEFLLLQEMPTVPTHDGLTSTGWNYSLANAQSYIQEYGKLDIGATYDTSHHGINIIIYLNKFMLSDFRLTIADASNSGTIYWGDGSTTYINSGSSFEYTHNYSQEGLYKVQVVPNGTITITSGFMTNEHKVRANGLEIGTNVILSGENIFQDFNILETISMPNKQDIITTTHRYAFRYCRILKTIILPQGVVNIPEYFVSDCGSLEHFIFCDSFNTTSNSTIKRYAFNNCSNIRNMTLPEGITTTADYVFKYAYNWTKVVIPKTLALIQSNSYDSMRYIKVFDFTHHTSVPKLNNANAFGYIYVYKIVVPDDLYSTWITTSNWSSLSSYIVRESDFNL